MKLYPVSFEIAGPAAIFTRPDSGAAFVTYPVPTYSAVRGMFDCVARWQSAYLKPLRVEICSPIQFQRYATNYGGPLRKKSQLSSGSAYQLYATILVDVCYKVYGIAAEQSRSPQGNNHLHAVQELFLRRMKRGSLYRTPCLGWSEFTPTYFGPLRESTKVLEDIQLTIPSMLHSVFSGDQQGGSVPRFVQDIRIEKGVLNFAE